MLRRYIIIINILLIVLGIGLIGRICNTWERRDFFPKDSSDSEKSQIAVPVPALAQAQRTPRPAYEVIVNKDLFRPERTEWRAPVGKEEETEQSKGAPKIKVYGIVISDTLTHAWICLEGKNEKARKVAEGETLDGWSIRRIDPEYIELTKGEEVVTYKLIEPGEPKTRLVPKPAVPAQPKKAAAPPKPQKRSPKSPARIQPRR
ncbi:MAG: hypothetical protein JXD19_01775 [Deltaproteobacteria bacterium]|nr:hypothetical protein [Deltaproteobacteria bacterium]